MFKKAGAILITKNGKTGANLKERVVSPDQFMSEEESEKIEITNQSKTVKKKASKKKKSSAKKRAKAK